MVTLTVVSFEPVTVCEDDLFPYVPLTVPYSNHAVDDNPFALTVPVSVAEVAVTLVAEPVTAVGGCVAGVGEATGVGEGVGCGAGEGLACGVGDGVGVVAPPP